MPYKNLSKGKNWLLLRFLLQRLTASELQLLKYAVIDNWLSQHELAINIKAYSEFMGFNFDVGYEYLNKAIEHLFIREFSFKQNDMDICSKWIENYNSHIENKLSIELSSNIYNLFDSVGKVEVLSMLNRFSGVPFIYLDTCQYSGVILDWLISTNQETVVIDYEDLRKLCCIDEDKYLRKSNFLSRVLNPAVTEIREKPTGYHVYYENVMKDLKSVKGYEFTVKQT